MPGTKQGQNHRRGKLFIVSAPSGTGKTTLCNAIRKRFPELAYSISYTTRPPRKNEVHGRDYYFIPSETFEEKIRAGEWAEWARVHGNYYGTSARQLNTHMEGGRDILLDIDVNGARQIKNRYPESIAIFIMPPSMEALEERLRNRGTDSGAEIEKRLAHAHKEIDGRSFYDHEIVNDRIEDAVEELAGLITGYSEKAGTQSATR